jgi:hypothetical protein
MLTEIRLQIDDSILLSLKEQKEIALIDAMIEQARKTL